MKNAQKFALKFAFALVLLFGIISCDGCKQKTDDIIVTADDVKEIIITDDQAKSRFENYSEHRGKIIERYENNGRKFDDSISPKLQYNKSKEQDDKAEKQDAQNGFVPVQYTYYKYDDFKKYLKFIEQETKKAGADISTIRIYFANYPENERDEDKQKRNTVMFVPTIEIDGKESAYYISDEGVAGKSIPFLLTDSLKRTGKAAPIGSLDVPKKSNEANLLPNFPSLTTNPPPPFYGEQSVIGNEGGRNPPSEQ